MPTKPEPKFLSMSTREADGVRCGIFGTGDPTHPLLIAEGDGAGGFDFVTARRIPFAEAFSMLAQINIATNALN